MNMFSMKYTRVHFLSYSRQQQKFCDKEWQNICWFEAHVFKIVEDDGLKLNFNEIVWLKHTEFQNS